MTTNDKLYELIDRMRLEAKADNLRQTDRLERLEATVSKLQVSNATLNTKIYILVFIITTIVSSIISGVVPGILPRIKS